MVPQLDPHQNAQPPILEDHSWQHWACFFWGTFDAHHPTVLYSGIYSVKTELLEAEEILEAVKAEEAGSSIQSGGVTELTFKTLRVYIFVIPL